MFLKYLSKSVKFASTIGFKNNEFNKTESILMFEWGLHNTLYSKVEFNIAFINP